jgi:ribosomal protein L24E
MAGHVFRKPKHLRWLTYYVACDRDPRYLAWVSGGRKTMP